MRIQENKIRRTFDFRLATGIIAAAAWAGVSLTPAAWGASPIEGVFALENTSPGVDGELVAVPQGTPLNMRLDIMFHRVSEKNAMKKYETIGDRQMHVTVVSDDLNTMIERRIGHVIDGHGQAWVRFSKDGLYHVFVDATPKTLPLQIVRFDLRVGKEGPVAAPALGASPVAEAHVGPYLFRFDSLDLPSLTATTLHMHVTEMGKPARSLPTGQGHEVEAAMIAADDLHVVPITWIKGDNPANFSDPSFRFAGATPGTYRIFVSFYNGRTLYVAPFVAVVR